MRINNPKRFGMHMMVKRKEAGLHPKAVAEKAGIDQRMLYAIETGQIGGMHGADIDDDILIALTDTIPGFSIATSPGVTGKPMSRDEMEGRGISLPSEPSGYGR